MKSSSNSGTNKDTIVRMYVLHALTPLHAGVGEGLGAINLPTARERFTGYPFMPGSSVKGVLRDHAEPHVLDRNLVVAFGPSSEHAADSRGGLVFTDANLVCLPIRSLFGTFAWVTCPFALRRFARDAIEAKLSPPDLPASGEKRVAALPKDTCLVPTKANDEPKQPSSSLCVFLEELAFPAHIDDAVANAWATWIGNTFFPTSGKEQAFFKKRFVIVPDDAFRFFTKLCLEVRNRVKIDDDRGTAASSGPWTEEHMPTETLLSGLAIARHTAYVDRTDNKKDAAENPVPQEANVSELVLNGLLHDRPILRFGGHASVGMGRARIALASATLTPKGTT